MYPGKDFLLRHGVASTDLQDYALAEQVVLHSEYKHTCHRDFVGVVWQDLAPAGSPAGTTAVFAPIGKTLVRIIRQGRVVRRRDEEGLREEAGRSTLVELQQGDLLTLSTRVETPAPGSGAPAGFRMTPQAPTADQVCYGRDPRPTATYTPAAAVAATPTAPPPLDESVNVS